ncbi:MAG TPA: cyclopropane-fatty-acyl-phospholipid synthase family protein [Streptosporangiaceae bacterium]|nr:cyclopropane-fatty-acyl-phospholipid synthase family protein [Streptosporangiaceae bacterium]
MTSTTKASTTKARAAKAGAPGARATRVRASGRPAGSAIIDETRWPGIARPGGSAVRGAIASVLFRAAAGRLPLIIRLPNGRTLGAGGSGAPEMMLYQPRAFFRRMGTGGLIGLGEAYMAGEWDSPDLTALLTVFAEHVGDLIPPWLQRLRRLAVRRHPATDDPTPDGARQNIHRHYDLSNDLFALFLDDTMTYSAALFATGAAGQPIAASSLLAEAQGRKIDRLLDRAGVGPGTRLLEIGTGWGELAIRAAARGAEVLSVTISPEQQALATRRIAAAGYADRARVELRDYREVEGQFDAIVSAEMIEAVGQRYWPSYFAALDRLLVPGGRIGLQAITMAHDRMLATRHTYTWIHKYIFPGGLIPSVTAIRDVLAGGHLRVTGQDDFGSHYAETLRLWRERFTHRAEQVRALGFDDVFLAMWTFYLSYSEAGFRSGYLDVCQLTLMKDQ